MLKRSADAPTHEAKKPALGAVGGQIDLWQCIVSNFRYIRRLRERIAEQGGPEKLETREWILSYSPVRSEWLVPQDPLIKILNFPPVQCGSAEALSQLLEPFDSSARTQVLDSVYEQLAQYRSECEQLLEQLNHIAEQLTRLGMNDGVMRSTRVKKQTALSRVLLQHSAAQPMQLDRYTEFVALVAHTLDSFELRVEKDVFKFNEEDEVRVAYYCQ